MVIIGKRRPIQTIFNERSRESTWKTILDNQFQTLKKLQACLRKFLELPDCSDSKHIQAAFDNLCACPPKAVIFFLEFYIILDHGNILSHMYQRSISHGFHLTLRSS